MSIFSGSSNPGLDLEGLTSTEKAVLIQIADLGDPDADKILFWDDSESSFKYLGVSGGLTITTATLSTPQWVETEVDFGSGVPKYDASFTVTDATVTGSSKIVVSQSGNVATGRVGNDGEWDSIVFTALAGTGNFSIYCIASPGPVVGKRKIYYMVA